MFRILCCSLLCMLATSLAAQSYAVSWGDINGGFQSVSGTMNAADFRNDPDLSGAVTLPSAFTYFGVDYTSLQICVHGFVRLGTGSTFSDYTPDHAAGDGRIIAAHWFPKFMPANTQGEIGFTTVGDEFIIEWHNVDTANPSMLTVVVVTTMQIRLNLANGAIEFHYADPTYSAGPFFDTEDHAVAISDHGPGGTFGIVNGELIDGSTTYVDGATGVMHTQWPIDRYIRFTPANGHIEVREGATSTVIANGDTSPAGTERDFGTRDIADGPTAAREFVIHNTGTQDLEITAAPTLTGTGAGHFILTLPTGMWPQTVSPSGTLTLEVEFDPTSTGAQTATVNIPHNDATTNTPFTFTVTGFGSTTGGGGPGPGGGGDGDNGGGCVVGGGVPALVLAALAIPAALRRRKRN